MNRQATTWFDMEDVIENAYAVGELVRADHDGPEGWVRIGRVEIPAGHLHKKMQGKCLHDYVREGWRLSRVPTT